MIDDLAVSRRTVLAAGAAGAGAVALAACGTGSNKKADNAPATGPIVKLADVEVGRCVSADLPNGKPAIVARPTTDTAVAFSAKCTHMGCTVKPAGTELHCPCHGSVYNATTGAVLQGPASRALDKIDVHVANGEVVAG